MYSFKTLYEVNYFLTTCVAILLWVRLGTMPKIYLEFYYKHLHKDKFSYLDLDTLLLLDEKQEYQQ